MYDDLLPSSLRTIWFCEGLMGILSLVELSLGGLIHTFGTGFSIINEKSFLLPWFGFKSKFLENIAGLLL